jgi:hypothetical protein
MHFAAWLAWRVGDAIRRLLPQQRRRHAVGARRDGGRGVAALRLLVDVRRLRRARATPIDETHPTRPINAYGETKLAIERALPHYERAYGLRSWRCATSTRRAPIRTASSARTTTPEIHLIPRRSTRARRAAPRCGLRRRLPDARRHLPARLHPRDRPGRRARAGAGPRSRRAGVGGLQPRHRHAALGARGHRHVERWWAAGAVDARAARPGDPGGALRVRDRIRHALGWTPRFADLDGPSSSTRGVARAHPRGYARTSPRHGNACGCCGFCASCYARPHRALIAGRVGRWWCTPSASAGLAYLIKPIFDNVLPNRTSRSAFVALAILVVYLVKGARRVLLERT